MTNRIETGDKVAVPVGTVDVIGTVLEVYGPASNPQASVELPLHGSTGATLESRVLSYPLSVVRCLSDLELNELRSHIRRYRPTAAVSPGQPPPLWDWEPFAEVRAELLRRGLTDIEIDALTWDPQPGDD